MYVEIITVDNVTEIEEESINISIIEEGTEVIEIDNDTLNVVVMDGESEFALEIVEEYIQIAIEEEVTQIIEIENSPSGGGFGSPYQIIDFEYNTPSPLILVNMLPGDYILDTELDITEAFDDPAATLSIGTTLDNELLIGIADNKPTRQGTYGSFENFPFEVAEPVRLFISPGSSSSGSGRVVLLKV